MRVGAMPKPELVKMLTPHLPQSAPPTVTAIATEGEKVQAAVPQAQAK